jgi:hypothetical protein
MGLAGGVGGRGGLSFLNGCSTLLRRQEEI